MEPIVGTRAATYLRRSNADERVRVDVPESGVQTRRLEVSDDVGLGTQGTRGRLDVGLEEGPGCGVASQVGVEVRHDES
ncbi:MAG TPA: hypothetical protein QGI67_07730, partial [Acidimicrobiales bacterium]|nr:hypothetical protein [Acidimicrobiales bacterium]